jgi:hypothetical protein
VNRITTFLFVTLIVLLAASVFFNGYKKVVVDSANRTADVIREAGR